MTPRVAKTISKFYTAAGDISDEAKNTFEYLFLKFKKGIYIRITDSVLTFVPFCNKYYTNEWHRNIKVPEEFYKRYTRVLPKSKWHANNAIFKFHPNSGDMNGVDILFDMFQAVCNHTPGIYFEGFVNKRDHPILRTDRCEPYTYIFPELTPLVSYSHDSYSPILSMCSGVKGYDDILIPTWNDWANVSDKVFRNSRKTTVVTKMDKLFTSAVFRGSSTGFQVDDTNPRIRISMMDLSEKRKKNGDLYLDAGITYWNERPRFTKDGSIVWISQSLIDNIPLKKELTLEEQADYRYIVTIDGHTSAYRLTSELGTGSVLLLVDSPYRLWIHEYLTPWVHYAPISSDLSDLYETIDYLDERPELRCEMVRNALEVFHTRIHKKGILEKMIQTLH